MDDLTEHECNWIKSPEDKKYDEMEDQEIKKLTREDLPKVELIWPLDDDRVCFGVKLSSQEKPF